MRRKLLLTKMLKISKLFIFSVAFFNVINLSAQCADQRPEADCDGDGVNNFDDLDDDNDGILDADECGPLTFNVFITEVQFETPNFVSDAGINDAACDIAGCNLAPQGGGITTGDPINGFNCWIAVNGTVDATKGDHPVPTGDAAIFNAFADNPGNGSICRDIADQNGNGRSGEIVALENIQIVQGASYSVVIYAAELTNTDPGTDRYAFRFFEAGTANQVAGIPEFQLNNLDNGDRTWQLNETDFIAPITGAIDVALIQTIPLALGADVALDAFSILTSQCSQDTDNDGIFDVNETDSDNDGCSDANEAFNNSNADGGDGGQFGVGDPLTLAEGEINADGTVVGAPSTVNVPSSNVALTVQTNLQDITALDGGPASFEADASAETATSYVNGNPVYGDPGNASSGLVYVWFRNGSVIDATTDGGIYRDFNTRRLFIDNVSGLDGNVYSVNISHPGNVCTDLSDSATLSVVDPCDAALSGLPDTDGDGLSNVCDLDDDNDGILDTDEGYVAPSNIATPTRAIYDDSLNGQSVRVSGRLASIESCDTSFTADFSFVSTGGDIPALRSDNRGGIDDVELAIRYSDLNDGNGPLSGTSEVTYTFSEPVDVILELHNNAANENLTFITPFDRSTLRNGGQFVQTSPNVIFNDGNATSGFGNASTFEYDDVTSITLGIRGLA